MAPFRNITALSAWGQTDLVTMTGVERNALGAVVMQVKDEIAPEPLAICSHHPCQPGWDFPPVLVWSA
ncbi:MAG: hypothetical protein ACLU9S_12550 [Oscillospiraceae bacterium]